MHSTILFESHNYCSDRLTWVHHTFYLHFISTMSKIILILPTSFSIYFKNTMQGALLFNMLICYIANLAPNQLPILF